MLDLETLGRTPGCIILSIAGIMFDLETGETGEVFNERISVWSCRKKKMYASRSTVDWWRKQDKVAFDLAFSGREDIVDVLWRLRIWAKQTGIPYRSLMVWGNSARFDLGILSRAFSICQIPLFYNSFNEVDFRTVIKFAPHIRASIPFEGTKHDPVDDCRHQIQVATTVWNLCNKVEKTETMLSNEYVEKQFVEAKG